MPQPVAPTMPLHVTLEAQQWNAVIALLQEVLAPNRVTTPLIQAIGEQLQKGAEAVANIERGNGRDHHPEAAA
jgi:hypothetical protein